jgi:benzoyl-CoA reductase/2-hydroxyglutaryl-CoA dehydratase subunit BcrC/BadD/HgdB
MSANVTNGSPAAPAAPAPVAPAVPVANRLKSTRLAGQMVKDYWDRVFSANERGAHVVWYNGAALNPIFDAAGLEWCHGEAFSARLAAMHLEGPAQLAAEEYGYINELCSYSRTHLGCSVLTVGQRDSDSGVVGLVDQEALASRLPQPDFFVNAYAGCSTGQQWDEISFRVFGKEIPIFKVSYPMLWGNRPDAGYLTGSEWDEASQYVRKQLLGVIEFIEGQTGRKFDWDHLREAMRYIKRAAVLRKEALDLCKVSPSPATYWDFIASIAPINFLPGNQALVDYFQAVKDEIQERRDQGITALPNERYRLYFDGIMNWNKVGWLANKFATHDAAVLCGRYINDAFWQEPQLIDDDDPLLGMAQHYLLCPTNHGYKSLQHMMLRDCRDYGVDGVVFHSTRTCRAFTGPQQILAKTVQNELGVQTMFFEGDVADASFYKDEILESRLAAMLEAIDVRRMRQG